MICGISVGYVKHRVAARWRRGGCMCRVSAPITHARVIRNAESRRSTRIPHAKLTPRESFRKLQLRVSQNSVDSTIQHQQNTATPDA